MSQPRVTTVSLLSVTRYAASGETAAKPWLTAAANPRFSAFSMTRSRGHAGRELAQQRHGPVRRAVVDDEDFEVRPVGARAQALEAEPVEVAVVLRDDDDRGPGEKPRHRVQHVHGRGRGIEHDVRRLARVAVVGLAGRVHEKPAPRGPHPARVRTRLRILDEGRGGRERLFPAQRVQRAGVRRGNDEDAMALLTVRLEDGPRAVGKRRLLSPSEPHDVVAALVRHRRRIGMSRGVGSGVGARPVGRGPAEDPPRGSRGGPSQAPEEVDDPPERGALEPRQLLARFTEAFFEQRLLPRVRAFESVEPALRGEQARLDLRRVAAIGLERVVEETEDGAGDLRSRRRIGDEPRGAIEVLFRQRPLPAGRLSQPRGDGGTLLERGEQRVQEGARGDLRDGERGHSSESREKRRDFRVVSQADGGDASRRGEDERVEAHAEHEVAARQDRRGVPGRKWPRGGDMLAPVRAQRRREP